MSTAKRCDRCGRYYASSDIDGGLLPSLKDAAEVAGGTWGTLFTRLADLIEPAPKCDRYALLALADRMAMMPQCDLCPVTVSCTEHADGCAGALMGHYSSSIREACGEAR